MARASFARVACHVLLITALITTMTGCTVDHTPRQPTLDEVRTSYLAYRSAIAEVQSQISTEPWESRMYGDIPQDCVDDAGASESFSFMSLRIYPFPSASASYRFPVDAKTSADDMADWLLKNDWNIFSRSTFGKDNARYRIQASNDAAGITDMTIDFASGKVHDGVEITTDTVCFEGNGTTVFELMFTGEQLTHPTQEAPGDRPFFGNSQIDWDQ